MTTTTTTEQPFTFAAPSLPPRPFPDGKELEANRDTLHPAAQAYTAAASILERALPEAERIANDPTLTEIGKRQAFTDRVADPALRELREHQEKLTAVRAVLQDEAKAASPAPVEPSFTDADRHEMAVLADAFGRLTDKQKIDALQHAMTGKDPVLRRALAYTHPIVTKLGASTIERLRAEMNAEKVDPAALEHVRTKAEKVGKSLAALHTVAAALENASDRAKLREAGLATLRRSDLSDREKVDFIAQHGLEAFKRLPS
jgi:hypothetical protein